MLVTGIERTKKGRFSIYCDGEFVCALHPDIFASSPLTAGATVTGEEMAAYQQQSEAKITKDRALRLLSARSYTRRGLYRKLIDYADEDTAWSVVDRMEELGLVNDADYARRYASDCTKLKGYSIRRTKQALMEKGIDRDIADDILSEMDFDPEPAIARVICRKYLRYLEDEKGIIKTTNALLRLGYSHGDIRRTIANLCEDIEYYSDYEE